MQPETLNRSIQPTPTVHPRGFTPTSVQFWAAANTRSPTGSKRCGAVILLRNERVVWSVYLPGGIQSSRANALYQLR